MPRLSGHHLLGLASLLVALTLGVVLLAELPAILGASRSARQPTSAATHTPAPTPAITPASTTSPPRCTDSTLSLTAGRQEVNDGGWLGYAMVLTNQGGPCLIGGYPTVTRLNGDAPVPTGDDFIPGVQPSFTLATGHAASFTLQWYTASGPPICPTTTGLSVALPGSSTALTLAFTLAACSKGAWALQETSLGPGGTGGVG